VLRLTDKVIALDGFDHPHVGAGLLLHVHLLHPHQLITPSQVSNQQSIRHPICLQVGVERKEKKKKRLHLSASI